MYNKQRIIAIIPARGGSKGVKRKNIRDVAGKPLIQWTIDAAHQSKYLDRCILSSEDDEIINIAKSLGCDVPFIRPKHLAEDNTTGIAPILHALTILKEQYDYVMILQPTSPLRNVEDIDNSIELCFQHQANYCVSVTTPSKHPYWSFYLKENQLKPLQAKLVTRRQELPDMVALNGAIYLAKIKALFKDEIFIHPDTLAYQMPASRSFDIDTELDLKICQFLLEEQQ